MPFRILNFFKELVLALLKEFCLSFQWQWSLVYEMSEDYKAKNKINKAKVQCTIIKFLKLHFFVSISSIKIN